MSTKGYPYSWGDNEPIAALRASLDQREKDHRAMQVLRRYGGSVRVQDGGWHYDDGDESSFAEDPADAILGTVEPAPPRHVCGCYDYFYAITEKGLPECPACVAERRHPSRERG